MNKTLIIGAGGKIGTILLSKLAGIDHPTVAMLRPGSKATAPDSVEVIAADLEQEFAFALEGCNRVIFTAGSGSHTGPDKTLLVDLWGAAKAIDAAKERGIEHFIMISSRGAKNPDLGPQGIKPYTVAKYFADQHLIRSGLNYTILRPGRLTDEAASGLIKTIRPENPEEQFISRADTADVVLHCLNSPSTLGKIYELYQGQETIPSVVC